jgi:hypothetical protein
VESTLLAGGKSKEKKKKKKKRKKDGNLGDSARGQADPRSVAVYTMNWPGRVICMYVCVGTVFHAFGPTDPLVVALGQPASQQLWYKKAPARIICVYYRNLNLDLDGAWLELLRSACFKLLDIGDSMGTVPRQESVSNSTMHHRELSKWHC